MVQTEIGKLMRSISKPPKQVPPLPDMRAKAGYADLTLLGNSLFVEASIQLLNCKQIMQYRSNNPRDCNE